MKKYCDICDKEFNTKIITKQEHYTVYGEDIVITAKVRVCENCGEELFDEELDNSTLIRVYNEYRKRHKLLLPEEIKQIREQYSMSQRGFARLLNWGDKTVRRYENGSLQDKAHNSILLFLREPLNMKQYLLDNEVNLSDNEKKKLELRIDTLIENGNKDKAGKRLINYYFQMNPSIKNGFKTFDFEKFYAVILFFASKGKELLKVKVLKLLNYSDMLYYKENGVSITGTEYVHLPFGPVPKNYDMLFGVMTSQNLIDINVSYENGFEKHQIVPKNQDYRKILNDDEIDVLERVYDKYKNYGSMEISNYSHNEKGYKMTKDNEVISYAYAKDIAL